MSETIGRLRLEAAGVALGEEYERFIDHLADVLLRPGAVVVDGGANGGRHTIPFARRIAPGGAVHAFEPLADILDGNRAWARSDGFDAVVRYAAVALWDAPGESVFHRNISDPAWSSLRFQPPGMTTEPVRVRLATLDQLLPTECVDFIKLDVEGAELPALRGGPRLLARSAPFVVFENALQWAATCFGYTVEDFFGLFARHGLQLFDAFGRPFSREMWDNPDVGWYFCAFPPSRLTADRYRTLAHLFWDRAARAADGAPRAQPEAAATADVGARRGT